MLHAFHNSSLFQIFRCKGHRVCFCATILILGAAAWSNALVFRNLSFNLDSYAKKLRLGSIRNNLEVSLHPVAVTLTSQSGVRAISSVDRVLGVTMLAIVKKSWNAAADGFGSTRFQVTARPSFFPFLMSMVSGKVCPHEQVNETF
jgi:hypothetical protein